MSVVLDLSVPAGGRVRTAWRPAVGEVKGWVWVQHGFSRRARNMAGVAELLSAHGYVTVAPDIATLRPWRSMHDATWLTSVAATMARAVEVGLIEGRGIPVGGPWLGVGHSAGAAIVAHAAMVLRATHRSDALPRTVDVAGLALLDPVDSVGGLFARALPTLDGLPLEAQTCRPSSCNRQGILGDELARSGRLVAAYPNLNHGDPERIPRRLDVGDVPAPSRAIAAVCGAPGSPNDVLAMATGLLASVERCRVGE